MLRQLLQSVLTNPLALAVWGGLVLTSLAVLGYDLVAKNAELPSLMKLVWGLTVLYSGPLGLAIYTYAGRTQIPEDDIWRRGFRSVAHCYSGCGMGEVIGVIVTAGLLALDTHLVIVGTFAAAYVLGYALTVGPLMQEEVPFWEAMTDAFYSETPSITVMEIAAIGTDVWLAGEAHIGDVLFWSGLVFSLTIGLVVAYPVNLALIRAGVKEGMGNPATMG
ncbi:DUF4396 domain-containing protein [Natronomonas sp. EA1]|uniref:DUF4396 domain-containing protein n=1 Tax=Natronomonas sp. EA1 TaxID=3421655 RepID=UPI003EBF5376